MKAVFSRWSARNMHDVWFHVLSSSLALARLLLVKCFLFSRLFLLLAQPLWLLIRVGVGAHRQRGNVTGFELGSGGGPQNTR